MDSLIKQVEDSMKSFHIDCESHQLWNNVKPSLKQLLASDKPQASNDPDNIADLLSHVHEVERLLFVEVNYDRAPATAEAARELFETSNLPGIGKLLSGDALALLHKLYTLGNVSSVRTNSYEEDNDDDIIAQALVDDVNE